MAKTALLTIRLSPKEMREMEVYLKKNMTFESISSLGRVAMMEFIRSQRKLELQPLEPGQASRRPSFLWDYDLTQAQVQEILHHAPMDRRKWLIARILERAPLKEVLRYLSLEEIRQALPHLRMDPKVRHHWQEAVELWLTAPQRS